MGDRERFIEELRKAWRDEKSSALTYNAAAEREADPKRKDIFRRMAAEEVKHAERWEKRTPERTRRPPPKWPAGGRWWRRGRRPW
jgi:rubrerythrin